MLSLQYNWSIEAATNADNFSKFSLSPQSLHKKTYPKHLCPGTLPNDCLTSITCKCCSFSVPVKYVALVFHLTYTLQALQI